MMSIAADVSEFDVLGVHFSLSDPDKSTLRETLPGHIYEPSVSALITDLLKEEGACFLDIGALYGYFTCFAGRINEKCAIHAFEPAPHYFETLKSNVARNRLSAELHCVALSDENGTIGFKGKTLVNEAKRPSSVRELLGVGVAAARTAWSTVVKREQARDGRSLGDLLSAGRTELLPWLGQTLRHAAGLFEGGESSEVQQVRTVRYDDFRREHNIRATIAKIDVHGAEGMVLAGMHDALREDLKHVILEVHTAEMLVKYTHADILEFLRSAGFRLYELIDYRSEPKPKMVELTGDEYARFIDSRRWTLKENLVMRMVYATR